MVVPLGPTQTAAFYVHAGVAPRCGPRRLLPGVPRGVARGGRYVALPPTRALDTRTTGHKPGPREATRLQVTGVSGVPTAQVSAVAMNVTLTESNGPGYVQVVPTGGATALGASSNLNAVAQNQTIANQVIVPIGADGSVTLYTQSGTHLVVDIQGYYTDDSADASLSGLFVPVSPTRPRRHARPRADGRARPQHRRGLGRPGRHGDGRSGRHRRQRDRDRRGGARATSRPIRRARATVGTSSTVNVERAGQTIANSSALTLGDGEIVSIYSQSGAHLIVDVQGYYLR